MNKAHFRIYLLIVAVLSACLIGAAHPDPSPEQLLRMSDRSRGTNQQGLSWIADVETWEGTHSDQVKYEVKVRGNDALAEAVAPPRSKGGVLLFNDRNLWYFKPGLRKPVSISPRQKLMGQVANGDIASTNYTRDYEARIVGEEMVRGELSWKLELKAKEKKVTYDRIRYWISKDRKLGIQAEFLTVSGQVFKRAVFEYKNKLVLDGKSYPFISKMTIHDALNPQNRSLLTYSAARPESLPLNMFNINNLVR